MRLRLLFATLLLTTLVGGPVIAFSNFHPGRASGGQNPRRVTIPAGTRILVRTNDSIDSSNSRVGFRFTGTLETNLQLDNLTVAPRGTPVHGQLVNAASAGRMSGGANLTLELTDIIINGTANPILTNAFEIRSQGQGGSTARRIVGGAGLGALVGGVAGGRPLGHRRGVRREEVIGSSVGLRGPPDVAICRIDRQRGNSLAYGR